MLQTKPLPFKFKNPALANFISQSAKAPAPVRAGADFESMLPVALEGEARDDFNSVILPSVTSAVAEKRAAKTKENILGDDADKVLTASKKAKLALTTVKPVTREIHSKFATYVTKVSGRLAVAFDMARYVVAQSTDIAIAETPAEKAEVGRYFGNQLEADMKNATDIKNIDDSTVRYLKNLLMGNTHVIRPSEKFAGGVDILFSGVPGATASLEFTATNKITLDRDYNYRRNKVLDNGQGEFDRKPAQAAIAFTRSILTDIFGSEAATVETQMKRIVKILPMDFDFAKSISSALPSLAGMGIDARELAKDFPKFETPSSYRKYFSLLAILDANKTAVYEKRQKPNALPGDLSPTPEGLVLSPQVSFSLVLHLTKEMASYITQTRPGGQFPLTPLSTWAGLWARGYLCRVKTKDMKTEGAGSSLNYKLVPRYVLSASITRELTERRKSLGLYTEDGRNNEDGIYVANNGTLNFCPKTDDLALDNARNYEGLLEEALQIAFDAGSPLHLQSTTEVNAVFSLENPEFGSKIKGFKETIKKYAGTLQAYSWDYNCILTVGNVNADRLNSISLSGAAIPDELALSDYLEKPFSEAMRLMFINSSAIPAKTANGKQPQHERVSRSSFQALDDDDTFGGAAPMLCTYPFQKARELYAYLLEGKLVPSFQKLVTLAAADLGIQNLMADPEVSKYEWPQNIGGQLHLGLMNAALEVVPTYAEDKPADLQMSGLYRMLTRALRDATGNEHSNVARIAYAENTDIDDDPHFFNPHQHPLNEFTRVYRYLGGNVFYQMLKAILGVDKKHLMVLDTTRANQPPSYASIVSEVMPLVIMLSKYVPDADKILAKGKELSEKNKRNVSITVDDIHVPGSKVGDPANEVDPMRLFPHQVEAHQFLRNAPRFSVLDIAPGGGKTITVLSDIACMVRERLVEHPIVACPTNLVRNWVEDMHAITEGKWNVIPITSETYSKWGPERLTEMIKKAPRNTVYVVGYTFLSKSNQFQMVIGSHVEKVYGAMEFMKKFGFDYVAMDESHRVKNPSSITHKILKELCTASTVKYVRLATGTLISNNLEDVVGQAAMFSSQIFRTVGEYKEENSELNEEGKVVWKRDTPSRARRQLAKHSAVITLKRKEWAFMLPMPVEEFIPVSMTKSEAEGGSWQEEMYDTVLKLTLKDLEAAMADENSDIAKLLNAKGARAAESESDPEPTGESEGESDQPKAGPTASDLLLGAVSGYFNEDGSIKNAGMDDDTLMELSMALGPYLQRLEMILTDPAGDKLGDIVLSGVNRDEFVSNKVLKVIERIKLNFTPRPWVKGAEYKKIDPKDPRDEGKIMSDVADFGDKRYILIPSKDKDTYYDPYYSHIEPDKDTERWKQESHGKVLVFCRYKRSVDAIFKALQKSDPKLAKVARRFHGDVKDKKAYLDAFKSSAVDVTLKGGVQILIAVEQSISEGHNMQMASRMIRVEAPWAPGELDQAASRIFRPDPKGKNMREQIYLDWILTDNSLEVAKMGRLISKMLTKIQFDEADNPHYDILKGEEYQLAPKSMSMDMLKEKETLNDIEAYTTAYSHMAHLIGAEFREMRRTRPNKMFDVEPDPMFEGASIIEHVPYVPNMKIPDRPDANGVVLDLKPMSEWLSNDSDPEVQLILDDPNKLKGRYVHTEMGNGVISGVTYTRAVPRKISTVTVVLDSGEEYSNSISMIHVSPLLTKETIEKLPKAPKMTRQQKVQEEKDRKRAEIDNEKEDKKIETEKKRTLTELERLLKIKKLNALPKDKPAIPEPKPKKPAAPIPPVIDEEDEPEDDEDDVEENNDVEFFPIVFNGFLAVDAIVKDDQIELKAHDFKLIKNYAYISVPDHKQFTGILAFLKSKFYIRKETLNRLEMLNDSFASGRGRKFDVDQAPVSEFKNFYNMMASHRLSKDKDETPNGKPELKIYPSIMNGKLLLNVDIATNPAIKRWLEKQLPNPDVKVKFEHAGAVWLRFAKTIRELKAIVKELTDIGFVHTNVAEFNKELAALKLTHAKDMK